MFESVPSNETSPLFSGNVHVFWVPKTGFDFHSGNTLALKTWLITKRVDSGASGREARQRNTRVSKSTHPRKFGNHVTVHRPSVCTTGKPRERLFFHFKSEKFQKGSLGQSVSTNFAKNIYLDFTLIYMYSTTLSSFYSVSVLRVKSIVKQKSRQHITVDILC